jgi:hypothetical protein
MQIVYKNVFRKVKTISSLAILSFVFLLPKTFKLFVFLIFDFERSWPRLFQRRFECTKLDIYVFISKIYCSNIRMTFYIF